MEITIWAFPGATQTTTTLYQHLHLPFPIADRLYQESKHQAWERGWELDPTGAIWTPQVKGG